VSIAELKKKLKPIGGMTSMAMMKQVASEYGVGLNPVKITSRDLKKGDIALLTINGIGHYVTIQSIDNNYVTFMDPIYGMIKITRAEFEKLYSGYALSEGNKEKEIPEEKQEGLSGGMVPAILLVGMCIFSYLRLFYDKKNRYYDPMQNLQSRTISKESKVYDLIGPKHYFNNAMIYPTGFTKLTRTPTFNETVFGYSNSKHSSWLQSRDNSPVKPQKGLKNQNIKIKIPTRTQPDPIKIKPNTTTTQKINIPKQILNLGNKLATVKKTIVNLGKFIKSK
jgi:hypothetical protein